MWWAILWEIKIALDAGQTVTLHCLSGLHRAALLLCLAYMYLLGATFDTARQKLEAGRKVYLDQAINQGGYSRRKDGTYREDHSIYIGQWETDALETTQYRVIKPDSESSGSTSRTRHPPLSIGPLGGPDNGSAQTATKPESCSVRAPPANLLVEARGMAGPDFGTSARPSPACSTPCCPYEPLGFSSSSSCPCE